MKRTLLILSLVAVCLLPSPATAQTPVAPADAVREMAKLGFLAGSWRGTGSVEYAPGQRGTFTSSEEVGFRLDGLMLSIEGIHFAQIPRQQRGPKVHQAFAMIHYDAARGDYAVRALQLDGSSVDTRGRLDNNAFVWGFEDPRSGHLRFTIRLSPDGKWTQTGERSADGKTWVRYFEMSLSKVQP